MILRSALVIGGLACVAYLPAATLDNLQPLQAFWHSWSNTYPTRPLAALGGHSRIAGFYTPDGSYTLGWYPITETDVPSRPRGNTNMEMGHIMSRLAGGIHVTNFARTGAKIQNWLGYPEQSIGQGWGYVAGGPGATGGEGIVAGVFPLFFIWQIGINDETVPETWAENVDALNWWKRSCDSNSIIPVMMSDPNLTWNSSNQVWCATNGVHYLDLSGETVTTWDGSHPDEAGYLTKSIAVLNWINSYLRTNVISAERRITWRPGIPGGITNRTVIYQTLSIDNTGATDVSSAIQTALNNCPAEQVVYLPAGVYRLNTVLTMRIFSLLRGAPNGQTMLRAHHNGNIIDMSSGNGLGTVNRGLLSGFTNGSISITTTSAPSDLYVGSVFFLSQTNQLTTWPHATAWGIEDVPTGFTFCGACSVNGDSSGDRSVVQGFIVTNIVNVTNIGFEPPLYLSFSNNLAPRIDYCASLGQGYGNHLLWAGIEDLVLARDNASLPYHGVNLEKAAYCWIKNVKFTNGCDRGDIYTAKTFRCEVRDCFFDDARGGGGSASGEGLLMFNATCDSLFENNTFSGKRNPISFVGPCTGNVIAYNFITNVVNANTNVMQPGINFHGAHQLYNLIEGNVCGKVHLDFIKGSASDDTFFRNLAKSRESDRGGVPTDSGQGAFWLDATNNRMNMVGNVLGYLTVTNDVSAWTNDVNAPEGIGFNGAGVSYVWRFSYSGYLDNTLIDPGVTNSLLRHGNVSFYDAITNWNSALTNLSQRILPISLYHSNRPSWFSNYQSFPAFGPENFRSGTYALNSYTNIPAGYPPHLGITVATSLLPSVELIGIQIQGGVSVP